jgi:beta-N-acetylhexosaminidase
MGAIIKTYGLKTTVRDTILAGADILLFANQLDYDPEIAKKTINIVMEMIADGTITRTRIDESYNRIMAIKQNIH